MMQPITAAVPLALLISLALPAQETSVSIPSRDREEAGVSVPSRDREKALSLRPVTFSRDNTFLLAANPMPAFPPSQGETPAPAAKAGGDRSKGLIALGLGLIGGGVALMVANPDLSEYGLTGSGQLYRKTYRVRLAGGIIAGSGGFALWRGLRKRN
jgi:hypothetical protein